MAGMHSVIPLLFSDIIQISQFICGYQNLNYSIVITTEIGDQNSTSQHGPYQHYGSATITQRIGSQIQFDLRYSLVLIINTIAGTIKSEEYFFGKQSSPLISILMHTPKHV